MIKHENALFPKREILNFQVDFRISDISGLFKSMAAEEIEAGLMAWPRRR